MINSLKQTLTLIKKNKFKILFLLLIQTLFFASLSTATYKTLLPSMQHAKTAMDYYESIKVNQTSGMFGYMGDDPLIIYDNYRKMKHYLKFMGLFSILSYLILNGIAWATSHQIINKKNIKNYFTYLLNFSILTSIFILLFYALVFNSIKSSLVKLPSAPLLLIPSVVLGLVLIYFLFISYTLIGKKDLKDIARLTFKIGIFRFPKVIVTYLINLAIVLLFFFLIGLTIELNMILVSIIVILFVFSFVFAKLFLIISINNTIKK